MSDNGFEEREDGREPIEGPGLTTLTSRKSSIEEPYRPGEAETVEWVENLYSDAEKGKEEQCDTGTWEKDLETFWGNQWTGAIPSYKPRIVVNEIKSLLLQELSDLTDSRLTVYVQKDRSDTARDTAVESAIQTFWKTKYCDMVVLCAALDAMIYPLGFLQTGIDPMAEQGQGEVLFKHRDPNTVFPDPDAEWDPSTGEEALRYFIFEDVLDLQEIRAKNPETGWRVQPEDQYSTKTQAKGDRPGPRAGSGYTGPLYTKTGIGTGVPGYKKARARQLTCVVDDDEMTEEIREIVGRLHQLRVPKYPHRRMIMTANRRVLYDEDCPFWYAPIMASVRLQPSVHSYWPQASLVGEFAEIQSTANKMDSMVAENMLRLNVGHTFADSNSGINPKTFGGLPGAVYLRRPGTKIETVYPNPMPGEMVNAGERTRGFIRSTLGYPLSRTGAGTHGNVAAELAETEISQAMGLTRLRGRLLYQSVQKAVNMLFARMTQTYTTPRHLPYIDQGELKAVQWIPVATPDKYLVHLDEASFQIRSKTMMQRLGLMLAKMNMMPAARLLKILEIPDAEAIGKELMEQLKLQALAKQRQPRGRAK